MTDTNRRHILKMLGAAAALGVAAPARAQRTLGEVTSQHRRKFVLIHGAWHNGKAWDGVADILKRQGYDVEAPSAPGAEPGEDQTGIQFSDYVDAVVDVLRHQSRKVIVVAHSSAGMLIQAAAPRVKNAIERIVFCNAFIVANGQTQLDNLPADAAAGLTALAEQNGGIVPIAPLEGFVRGALMEGVSTARQDALLRLLVDQPISLFNTPVQTARFEALDIPKALLFCQRDHSADYLGMAARLGRYEVMVADGPHEMLFSAPHAFSNALLALVQANRYA